MCGTSTKTAVAPAELAPSASDEQAAPLSLSHSAEGSSQSDALRGGPSESSAGVEIAPSDAAAAPSTAAAVATLCDDECVICFAELDGSAECKRLECGHQFHKACVDEWIAKDGRCPVCRHVINEVVASRAHTRPGATGLPPGAGLGWDGLGGLGGLGALGGEREQNNMLQQLSRRLMVFATMEAALSVLVMSYIPDLLSPALMLLSACVTFYGANQFSLRAVAICRPVLGLNVIYHLYLVARLVHVNEGTPFFDDQYTTARTVLLSLGCVVVMELVALKKAGFFYLKLRLRNQAELDRLRLERRRQAGWVQRFIVVAMFLLICAPVVAKYVCQMEFSVAREICSS